MFINLANNKNVLLSKTAMNIFVTLGPRENMDIFPYFTRMTKLLICYNLNKKKS